MVPTELRVAIAAALVAGAVTPQTMAVPDPFAFFRPTVSLTDAEQRKLDEGDAIVKVVRARDREIAIVSAARVNVDGDRLVAWVRQIDGLKRGRYVSAIGRFSQPPRIEDLGALTLDDDDLEEVRHCRSGACGVKMSGEEIAHLRQTAAAAGTNWKPAVQGTFRKIVLARVEKYLTDGLAGSSPYHDQKIPVSLDAEFAAIIDESEFLVARQPDLTDYLTQYPRRASAGIESFLYWSKEALGGKPIITVTHVSIIRSQEPGVPEALVAARQIFATHYMTGSLALTTITGGADRSPRYLMYLNRSRVDVLDGLFGGLVRRIVERRLRTEALEVVRGFRQRLETGEPP